MTRGFQRLRGLMGVEGGEKGVMKVERVVEGVMRGRGEGGGAVEGVE